MDCRKTFFIVGIVITVIIVLIQSEVRPVWDRYFSYTLPNSDIHPGDLKHQPRERQEEEMLNRMVSRHRPTSPYNMYNSKKILLYSKYRTGSTFTSDFLNKSDSIFYSYEILKMPTENDILDTEKRNMWMSKALNCTFSELWREGMKRNLPLRVKQNVFCYKMGKTSKCANYPISRIANLCRKFPHQAIKVIRVRTLESLRPLMSRGVHVIHLVRDVRGMTSSILKLIMGQRHVNKKDIIRHLKNSGDYPTVLRDAKQYCINIMDDLASLKEIKAAVPNLGYSLVRYEDLALRPYDNLGLIYGPIGIDPDSNVRDWAWRLQHGDGSNRHSKEKPYETERKNSTQTALGWTLHLPFDLIKEVQSLAACHHVMEVLNYTHVIRRQELDDENAVFMKRFSLHNLPSDWSVSQTS